MNRFSGEFDPTATLEAATTAVVEAPVSVEAPDQADLGPDAGIIQKKAVAVVMAASAALAGAGGMLESVGANAAPSTAQTHTKTVDLGGRTEVTKVSRHGNKKTVTHILTADSNVQDGRWQVLGGAPLFPGGAHSKQEYVHDVHTQHAKKLLHEQGFSNKDIRHIENQTTVAGKNITSDRMHYGDASLESSFGYPTPVAERDVTITAPQTNTKHGVAAWEEKVTEKEHLTAREKAHHMVSKVKTIVFNTPKKCMNLSEKMVKTVIKYVFPRKHHHPTTTPTPTPTPSSIPSFVSLNRMQEVDVNSTDVFEADVTGAKEGDKYLICFEASLGSFAVHCVEGNAPASSFVFQDTYTAPSEVGTDTVQATALDETTGQYAKTTATSNDPQTFPVQSGDPTTGRP